jgi:hypothetical protein
MLPRYLKTNPCAVEAFRCLDRGWSVLLLCRPDCQRVCMHHGQHCDRPGKRPLTPWQFYQHQRPTGEELHGFFRRWPDVNIGLALGAVSGLIGIDVDGVEGETLLRQLPERLPPTWTFRTPGGGWRLLFRFDEEAVYPPNLSLTGPSGAEALHFLGDRSMTVLPPSLHHSGSLYRWLPGRHPDDMPAAVCPEALLRLFVVEQPQERRDCQGGGLAVAAAVNLDVIQRARRYLARCEPAVSGQCGHNRTLKLCAKLCVGFALSPEDAVALLQEDWNPRCDPPWSQAELLRKCQQAIRTSNRSAGFLLR